MTTFTPLRSNRAAGATAARRPGAPDWVVTCCLIAVVVTAGLTALRWVDSGNTAIVALTAARWLWGLAAVALLPVALWCRWPLVLLPTVALVLVHTLLAAPWFIGDGQTAEAGRQQLTVMSSNLLYGRADLNALKQAADDRRVDVLVLTEATPLDQQLDRAGLSAAYPHRLGRSSSDASGTLVLSRWPLTLVDAGQSTVFDNPVVSVATPAGPVRVQGVHSASPGRPAWRTELDRVGTVGDPQIMAGDFNATLDHPALRRMVRDYTDAHRATGQGWVRTWDVTGLAFAHIDHVFVRDLTVLRAGHELIPGTDHAAVWATVEV